MSLRELVFQARLNRLNRRRLRAAIAFFSDTARLDDVVAVTHKGWTLRLSFCFPLKSRYPRLRPVSQSASETIRISFDGPTLPNDGWLLIYESRAMGDCFIEENISRTLPEKTPLRWGVNQKHADKIGKEIATFVAALIGGENKGVIRKNGLATDFREKGGASVLLWREGDLLAEGESDREHFGVNLLHATREAVKRLPKNAKPTIVDVALLSPLFMPAVSRRDAFVGRAQPSSVFSRMEYRFCCSLSPKLEIRTDPFPSTEETGRLVEWLSRIQRPDGSMPVFVDHLLQQEGAIDVNRLAFVAWACAAYGATRGNEEALHIGERAALFVQKKITIASIKNEVHPLATVYLARYAIAVGDKPLLDELMRVVFSYDFSHADVITLGQAAALAILPESSLSADFRMRITVLLHERWKNKDSFSPAWWAEAALAMENLDPLFCRKINQAIWSCLRDDGLFVSLPDEQPLNSSGQAKMLEYLAQPDLVRSYYLTSLHLRRVHDEVNGGVRNQGGSGAAWIDTAGHLLLATSRTRFK